MILVPVKVEKHFEYSWRCLCQNNKIAALPSLVESLLCDGCVRRVEKVNGEWFIQDYPNKETRSSVNVVVSTQYEFRCPSCGSRQFPSSIGEISILKCGMCGTVIEQTGHDQWTLKEGPKAPAISETESNPCENCSNKRRG